MRKSCLYSLLSTISEISARVTDQLETVRGPYLAREPGFSERCVRQTLNGFASPGYVTAVLISGLLCNAQYTLHMLIT